MKENKHNLRIVVTFRSRAKFGDKIQWKALTVYEMFYFFKIIFEATLAKC